jgi:NADH:ubiquinone oxidoreductase subunit C
LKNSSTFAVNAPCLSARSRSNRLPLLRDDPDLRYNFLTDIVCRRLLPDFPRFAVSYQLYSIPHNHRLRLRVGRRPR